MLGEQEHTWAQGQGLMGPRLSNASSMGPWADGEGQVPGAEAR